MSLIDVPDEILGEIVKYLYNDEFLALMLTCKRFYKVLLEKFASDRDKCKIVVNNLVREKYLKHGYIRQVQFFGNGNIHKACFWNYDLVLGDLRMVDTCYIKPDEISCFYKKWDSPKINVPYGDDVHTFEFWPKHTNKFIPKPLIKPIKKKTRKLNKSLMY